MDKMNQTNSHAIRWPLIPFLGLLFSSLIYSQERQPDLTGRKQKTDLAYISLIALAPAPSRRYQKPPPTEDHPPGSSTLSAHSPGSFPPSTLLIRSDANKESKKPCTRLRVGFNTSPGIQPVPANKTIRLNPTPDHHAGYHTPYLTLPKLKAATHSLVFLSRQEHGTTQWLKKPEVCVINMSTKQRVSKNMLICNFSNQSVSYRINQKIRNTLKPGKNTNLILPKGRRYHQIKASVTGAPSNLFDTSMRLTKHTITVLVFYNANPRTNAGKSVGVFKTTVDRIRESTLHLPPP